MAGDQDEAAGALMRAEGVMDVQESHLEGVVQDRPGAGVVPADLEVEEVDVGGHPGSGWVVTCVSSTSSQAQSGGHRLATAGRLVQEILQVVQVPVEAVAVVAAAAAAVVDLEMDSLQQMEPESSMLVRLSGTAEARIVVAAAAVDGKGDEGLPMTWVILRARVGQTGKY